MKKILEFLKHIHVPEQVIADLQVEESDIDISQISTTYLEGRENFFKSTKLKDLLDTQAATTAKGMTLKAIKKINELLGMGLTNTKMEEFKTIEDFLLDAKTFKSESDTKLKSGSNKDLIEDIEKWKTLASERQLELDKVIKKQETIIAKAESEKNDAIRNFKAKQYWNKLVLADTELADIPGKDFALEAIEERIFSKYLVTEDGKIFNKDKSQATHPEKEIVVTDISEIYPYYKEKAGLTKKNNAGGGSDSIYKDPNGKIIAGEAFGKAALEFLNSNS